MSSATCVATADGSGTNVCQATSLPPLPPIIRNDKKAYFQQRFGLPPLTLTSTSTSTSKLLINDNNDDNGDDDKKKKKIPKQWMNNKQKEKFNNSIPTNQECRLYMAPSSIPNSGLGMWAGEDIPPNTLVDINPQIVIPLIDIEEHVGANIYDKSVLSNYPWQGYSQGVHLEAQATSLLYPNLGMLANSHLGLTNINQKGRMRSRYSRVTDRAQNAGTGAISPFDGLSFYTEYKSNIKAGEEIFVDYGASYFHGREDVWGLLFPEKDDYNNADDILEEFQIEWKGKDVFTEKNEDAENMWKNTLELLEKGEYKMPGTDEDDNDEEEEKKTQEEKEKEIADKKKTQQRIAYALPKTVQDIPHVASIGTARNSVPDSTRSIDFLKENGFCLDNLRKGKSNIPQAGNGAFATNNIEAESVVLPVPLVPITRNLLRMYFTVKGKDKELPADDITDQILLNYCFGHPQSSLLFFPYSSAVHYVNHNNVNPNAYIRWSNSDMNKDEMFIKNVKDVYTGVLMEIVALRDIGVGEEVTIDYGPNWANAWYDHVASWDVEEESQINPQSVIETSMMMEGNEKKPIRTMEEQSDNPYPHSLRTACYSKAVNGTWTLTKSEYDYMRFCDITDRVYQGNNYWYTAKMYITDRDESKVKIGEDDLVRFIPQQAVLLTQDEYRGDLHVSNSFRRAIGVPEGLYPDKWLDLKNTANTATVKCDTTAGQFTMLFRRNWSPIGYDRVVELFHRGFYNNSHIFRVVPNFLAQFGISYTEDTRLLAFSKASINDDPQLGIPFKEGTISFAGSGPNSRTSHLFISYTSQNKNFGKMDWETPVGSVIEGMDVVRKLNSSYGDKGPAQHKIHQFGKMYVDDLFPDLDEIKECAIIVHE